MKKRLVTMLICAAMICSISVQAFATSKFDPFIDHIPKGIDLSPFDSSIFEVNFDDLEYSAEISSPTCPTDGILSLFQLDIKMVCANGQLNFVPRIIVQNYSSVYKDFVNSECAYFRIGENRYKINLDNGVAFVTGDVLDVIKQIAETSQEVKFKGESFAQSLSAGDISNIKKYYNALTESGILKHMPKDMVNSSSVEVITEFN